MEIPRKCPLWTFCQGQISFQLHIGVFPTSESDSVLSPSIVGCPVGLIRVYAAVDDGDRSIIQWPMLCIIHFGANYSSKCLVIHSTHWLRGDASMVFKIITFVFITQNSNLMTRAKIALKWMPNKWEVNIGSDNGLADPNLCCHMSSLCRDELSISLWDVAMLWDNRKIAVEPAK